MKRIYVICFLAILLLGLMVLFWFDFKNNLIAIGWDTIIPLNPSSNLKFLYTWTDINNGIVILSSLHFIFLLYALLEKLNLTLTFSQFFHTYVVHTVGALGVFYLSNVAFKNHSKKVFIAFLSAILYMFTPALFNMYYAYSSFAFIPLALALFIDGLYKKHNFIFAMLIGIVFAAGNLPDPNPRPFVITLAPIILYTCFEILTTRKLRQIFTFFFVVLLYVFLINSWYFLGFFMTAFQNSNLLSTAQNITYTYGGKLPDEGTSTINRMFRLFNDGLNMPLEYSTQYLSTWIITLINYVYPVTVFSSILFIKNKPRNIASKVIFFLVVSLIFVFLSKSANPPFGNFYRTALEQIPVLRAFRTTAYIILVAAICYSVLVAFTIVEIKEHFKNNFLLSKVVPILIFLLLIINSYPLLLGYPTVYKFDANKNFQRGRKITPSYYQLEKYLSNDFLDAKILTLPLTHGYESLTSDPNYYGIPLLPFIISKPLIGTRNNDFSNSNADLTSMIEDSIMKSDPHSNQLLGLSNIKYIILKKDSSGIDLKTIDKIIVKNYKTIKNYKEITLYQNTEEFLLPHFYIPRETFITDKPTKDLPKILKAIIKSHPETGNNIGLYFSRQNPTLNISDNNWRAKNLFATLEYKKINPTKYRVIVHNVVQAFPLIFIESYHPSWKIYAVNQKNNINRLIPKNLFIKKIKGTIQNDNLPSGSGLEPWTSVKLAESNHFIVNTFANSWNIDPIRFCRDSDNCIKNADGSYNLELIVIFESQKLADLGYLISLVTIGTTLVFTAMLKVFFTKKDKII